MKTMSLCAHAFTLMSDLSCGLMLQGGGQRGWVGQFTRAGTFAGMTGFSCGLPSFLMHQGGGNGTENGLFEAKFLKMCLFLPANH